MDDSATQDGPGEQPTGTETPETGTGLIPGNTFHAKEVQFFIENGLAIFEGDIVLGTVEEVAAQTQQLQDELSGAAPSAVVISGDQFRWPNGVVPHAIDPTLGNQQRVTDAIAHWESNTNYRFPVRTTEADFVTFRRTSSGCSANVGMRSGEQFVNVGPGCAAGNLIHEMGHTVGLWHEQSRADRDTFVTIHLDKVIPGRETEFLQHVTDGDDVGAYDYGSIMHYPRTAFSADNVSETITPTDSAAVIGQRTGLSPLDIAAANSLIKAAAPAVPVVPPVVPPVPAPANAPEYPGRLLTYPPLTIGEDVKTWQQGMVDRGFSLDADGEYGPISRDACIDLQTSAGLDTDGIVGPLTWAATFAP